MLQGVLQGLTWSKAQAPKVTHLDTYTCWYGCVSTPPTVMRVSPLLLGFTSEAWKQVRRSGLQQLLQGLKQLL